MNIVDIVILIIIALFGLAGMKSGFLRTTVSLVGIILISLLSFALKDGLAETLSMNLPFFNFTGAFKGVTILNVIMYQLLAFIIIFFILMAIYNIIVTVTKIVERLLKLTIILIIPSKIGGLIVGIIEGILVSIILVIFLSLPVLNFKEIRNSTIRKYIYDVSPIVGNLTSNTNDAIDEIIELKEKFDEEEDKTLFNIECFEVLLKHKVIGIEYSEKLIGSGKLNISPEVGQAIIDKYK